MKEKSNLFNGMWIWLVLALAALAVIFLWASPRNSSVVIENPDDSKAILAIDFGNGQSRQFATSKLDNTTAWDMLQLADASFGLNLGIYNGYKPETIKNLKNGENGGKEWKLYVNNKFVSAKPIDVSVEGGDVVVWRYE